MCTQASRFVSFYRGNNRVQWSLALVVYDVILLWRTQCESGRMYKLLASSRFASLRGLSSEIDIHVDCLWNSINMAIIGYNKAYCSYFTTLLLLWRTQGGFWLMYKIQQAHVSCFYVDWHVSTLIIYDLKITVLILSIWYTHWLFVKLDKYDTNRWDV